jgi:hypothetical protein
MKPSWKFQPQIDSLEDRITPTAIPITLSHVAASSIVVTVPTSPPPIPDAPTDDPYEPNNTFAAAHDIGTLTGTAPHPTTTITLPGLVMADYADWYKFTTTLKGVAGSSVSIHFLNSQGDLNLRMFDALGNQIGASLGTGNTEAVSLVGLPAGTYVVQVHGAYGAHNPNYTLSAKQAILTTTTTALPPVPVTPPVTPPVVPPSPPGVPTVPVIPPPPASGFNIALRFTGLTASEQFIFQQAANRWGQLITGDLPNTFFGSIAVDDLLIDASATPIDGVGGILGQSRPVAFRSVVTTGSSLPFYGTMQFDSADLAALQASGDLYSVVLHEMAHVMGFGTLWVTKNLISGAGTVNPVYVGPQAVAAYNQVFKTSGISIPVENTGGPGTADSHWRESVFGDELMTGYLNPGVPNPLSRVTVAAMADLGYVVNLNAADPYTPPSVSPPPPPATGGIG